ncbi:tryptophan dimethylallyltransferase-domain-containing protein [Xylaria sp. FL0064]|nr:tryptophan dimethylallyltransferase-domain-containing protein [Xylaria sp. FL0064]
MSRTHTLLQNQSIELDVSHNEFSAWKEVNLESPHAENEHQSLWYDHTGKALGMLLHSAGYSPSAQRRNLDFFKRVVVSNLGIFPAASEDQKASWQSFMTDDGTPLELSWDWGTGASRPIIRYSIEPVGLQAGMPLDPHNSLTWPVLQDVLSRILPNMKVETFHYFRDFFDSRREETPSSISSIFSRCFRSSLRSSPESEPRSFRNVQDHKSLIFYAFDLTDTGTTVKVYFFPKYRAVSTGTPSLEVLLQGIKGAPYCSADNLYALSVFSDFSNDISSNELEYEMLAIDLIDPLQSRFKIYFRTRETSFDSLSRIVTLGGRVKNMNMAKGLDDLHRLWNAIFGVNTPSDHPLKEVNHRTAGILFNVGFRLGDRYPVAKVYLPVRHYSSSDDNVIKGLDEYFSSHQRSSYMRAYSRALIKLFGSERLRSQAGVQTYVGCTIRPDGALRVVSYFKPPLSHPDVSISKAS